MMPRCVLVLIILAALGLPCAAQQPSDLPVDPSTSQTFAPGVEPDNPSLFEDPGNAFLSQVPPPVAPATVPPTSSYQPGEGFTVDMLNGTSRLKLFGQLSTIAVLSTDRPFSAGLPLFLLPPSPFGLSTNTFDLHARQSAFGAAFSGPEVLGFKPGGFFLGFIQNDNLTSDAYGLLPYQAYGDLKNEEWRLAGGLQSDVFNPGKPTIISLGSLFGSGNTGSFRGQFRVEHFTHPASDLQVTTQMAISEPVSSIVTNNARILEDNGWPNVEGRLAVGLGETENLVGGRNQRPVAVGVSGVVGQLRTTRLITAPTDPEEPNRAVVSTWGLGLDGSWEIADGFGISGELYAGQALGEYNGGVLQSFNPKSYQAIRTRGGFGEVYYYFTEQLHLHSGYGIDAPLKPDLAATQLAQNQTVFSNLVWDVSKVLQFSFEVDYRETEYVSFPTAQGVVFLSQMLLRF